MKSDPPSAIKASDLEWSRQSWIVEDDSDAAKAIQLLLQHAGCATRTFSDGQQLLHAIKADAGLPDIICLDLTLPDISGLDLLAELKQTMPNVPVIVVTNNSSNENIERAVQMGIYDYLPKNSDRIKFTTTFRRALEFSKLSRELLELHSDSLGGSDFGIVGISPAILSIVERIRSLIPVDLNIIVSGESGTGKDLVAHALHRAGLRKEGPFVTVNCAALPKNGGEQELFGYEGGSSGGITTEYIGAIERANGGTLYLNEIGELNLAAQARLLDAIEKRRFLRVGGTQELAPSYRLVVSASCDLSAAVRRGDFRSDLYYRLAEAEINLPALRFRPSDIRLLAQYFVQQFCTQLGKQLQLSEETAAILEQHDWPGNVRELQNAIQYAIIQCQGSSINPIHLPHRLCASDSFSTASGQSVASPSINCHGADLPAAVLPLVVQERELIVQSIRSSQGRISNAAKSLGISRATLYRKIRKYGLSTRGHF